LNCPQSSININKKIINSKFDLLQMPRAARKALACFRCPPHADGNRQADRAPTFKPKEATIKRIVIKTGFVVGLLAIFMVAAGPATAQKSSRDDHGKNGRDSQKAERAEPERIW
jgi:hypothetical protein